MTMLGAALYIGFFAAAALWLLLTSDASVETDQPEAGHRPDCSNPLSVGAHSARSNPALATHSSR